MDVHVERTAEDGAIAAMEEIRLLAAECIDARGRFVIALAGGSTPQRLYQLLGERSGKRYRLADRMRVKLVRVDLETRKVDFVPA